MFIATKQSSGLCIKVHLMHETFKTHVSGGFRLQNRLLFSSNDTSFRNGSGTSMKWRETTRTRVLDINDVVRNQIDVLEHRNGVKIPKILVLDLKKSVEIFHVVCLESYYSETFNQMHPDTSFRNGSGASTKWRETTQNMSFGPKVADWACPLLENKKRFWRHKLVH